jgi:hypothetical protein
MIAEYRDSMITKAQEAGGGGGIKNVVILCSVHHDLPAEP